MEKFVEVIVLILISHQIITIATYFSLRREDKGLPPREHSGFAEWILCALFFLPSVGNAFYEYSLGFVDHLRENRLCKMLVERDDTIERLKKENSQMEAELKLRNKYEDSILEISKLNPNAYSFSVFKSISRYDSECD